jgi:ABC-type glycerol-3-phosphate transport system substrate-binding protein
VAAWFFNRELLFKLNQSTEHIPTSWAALSALSNKVQKRGKLWGLGLPVAGDFSLARWSALGLSLAGASAPADAAADFAHKLWNARANWLPGAPSLEEASRRFLEQRAVVLLGSIEQSAYLKANAPFKLGSALPDGELSWFGTDFVVLNGSAEVGAGAREFLDYLYRPEVSLRLFQAAASLPLTRPQALDARWKKELDRTPLVKAAVARRLKRSGLEKIPPQVREEWAATIWKAAELEVPAAERGAKSVELRNALQKLLSTNPR